MERRIKSYDALFEFMPQMGAQMEMLDCQCAQPTYCFTHYLEPGYKDEDILVEICEAVTEKKRDFEDIEFKVFPKVPMAACIFHKGSYNTLHKSYAMLLQYIEENGYEICGNIRESYIDGIWNKETENEWLTEIQILVRKAGHFRSTDRTDTRLQDGKILVHKEMEALEEVIACAVAHIEKNYPDKEIQVEIPEETGKMVRVLSLFLHYRYLFRKNEQIPVNRVMLTHEKLPDFCENILYIKADRRYI